ncbi:hypothetical protein FRB99_003752, partial [Tulasnella sp. 403]
MRVNLSMVCTHWATVIDQTPTLWTVIHPRNGLQLAYKSIQKSGRCALHVSTHPPTQLYGTLQNGYFDLICSHVHRWKIAELMLDRLSTGDIEKQLENASAPQLRTLSIRTLQRHLDHDLFRGETDRLEELDVRGASLPWTSTLLHNLRILRLAYIEPIPKATTSRLLAVLQQCPNLEGFYTQSVNIGQSDDSDLPVQVALARLRSLELSSVIPTSSAFSIISHISSSLHPCLQLLGATILRRLQRCFEHPVLSQLVDIDGQQNRGEAPVRPLLLHRPLCQIDSIVRTGHFWRVPKQGTGM